MDAIAGRGAVQAYAIREGLIEKGGMFAIFVDNGCRPLGTSRVWSGGGKAADCVEQVLQGLELGAAGLVLVCDTPETAASAGDHVAALKRLARDYDLILLDVIHTGDDAPRARRPRPDIANSRVRGEGEPQRGPLRTSRSKSGGFALLARLAAAAARLGEWLRGKRRQAAGAQQFDIVSAPDDDRPLPNRVLSPKQYRSFFGSSAHPDD